MKQSVAAVVFGLFLFSPGCGDDSPSDEGDVLPPATVSDLRAVDVGDTSLTLTWTAPGDDGDRGRASTYDVRYSTVPAEIAFWWDSSTVVIGNPPVPRGGGEQESLKVESLAPASSYHFALRTADEVPNWSEISNVRSATTAGPSDDIPPGTVHDLAVDSVTASSVILGWTATGDDQGEGVASTYDLRYASEPLLLENWESANQVDGEPVPKPAGSAETFEVTHLTDGATYWFALRCADENANWSELSNGVAAKPDGTPPADVRDLEVASVTDSSAILAWTAPGDDGSSGQAGRYDFRYSTTPITEESWNDAVRVQDLPVPQSAGSTELVEVGGLLRETIYYFSLRTSDGVPNWSGPSNEAIGTTAAPGGGRVSHIAPDGSGDYPTIRAAIVAAVTGDVIELESGIYTGPGNRHIDFRGKAIAVRSATRNPADCIIDCAGGEASESGFFFRSGEGFGSLLQGVTIQNALSSGIDIYNSSPRILDCVLRNNSYDGFGGGVRCRGSLSIVSRCTFIDNYAIEGGGFYVGWNSSPTIKNCTFILNHANKGGGLQSRNAAPLIVYCTFAFNSAPNGGGISNGSIGQLSYPIVKNTMIVFSLDGGGLASLNDFATLSCCNIYGNTGGDWVGILEGQENLNNNLSVDPLFCDPGAENLMLDVASPCAPENNDACGLIGSLPVGCGLEKPRGSDR